MGSGRSPQHRSPSGTGRQDERVVAAIKHVLRKQQGRSKGTIKGPIPQVAQLLADRHGGTVPMPAPAARTLAAVGPGYR